MLRQRKLGECKDVRVIRFRMQNRRLFFNNRSPIYPMSCGIFFWGPLLLSVPRTSSDTDDRSIFWGVEIFDSVYFFGWLGLSWDFFGYSKQSERKEPWKRVCNPDRIVLRIKYNQTC